MKDLRFLFQQKKNSKIELCNSLVLSAYYTIKKLTTSIWSHFEGKPVRANGMLGKTDFEKNEKQNF